MQRGETQERLECCHRGSPPVEPERELVEVALEVLVTDAMVGAPEPGLEVAEDAVHSGQDSLGAGGVSLGAGPMAIAQSRQGSVALPGVRPHDGPRRDMGLNEAGERGARSVRDNLEPNPTRCPAPDLDGGHDQRLVEELAAAAQPHFGTPDVALVHFDLGLQRLPVGADHGTPQLLEQDPGRLVPGDPELPLPLEAGHAWRVRRDQVGGPKPEGERDPRPVQDGPGRDRRLLPTGFALPEPPTGQLERRRVSTPRTPVPVRPAAGCQVRATGRVVPKPRLELGQRLREVRPRHAHTLPMGPTGVNRISSTTVLGQFSVTCPREPVG